MNPRSLINEKSGILWELRDILCVLLRKLENAVIIVTASVV